MLLMRLTRRSTASARLPLRCDAGFGMAETLVSLVIFSAALLGIVGTAARVGMLVNTSHVRLQAGAVAQQQFEALLTEPYDSLANGTAERDGVSMGWTVSELSSSKRLVFVYQYSLPGGAGNDTLTAAALKP